MISPTEVAYAAGFFEGEGAIMLLSHGASRSLARVSAEVSQNDREPLDWLQERWGGRIYLVGGRNNPAVRSYHRWCVGTREAVVFLADIRPYIIRPVVEKRIALALAFQAQKTNTWHNRTEEYHVEQKRFIEEMSALNRRGTDLERAVLDGHRAGR